MNIYIDTKSLSAELKSLESNISDLNKIHSRINETTDSLGTAWKDNKSSKYIDFMKNALLDDLNNVIEELTSYYELFKGIQNDYDSLDDKYKEKKINI